MKEEIKNLWIEALRSGKYKQARQHLKYNNSFCCLGVLCDISEQGEWISSSYSGISNFLPEEVMSWAGMRTPNGILKDENHLARLNDHGYSFEEIADIIEEQWEEL